MENKLLLQEKIVNDSEYSTWFEELKTRYKKSQIKAAVKVNSELLEFYWSLGHDIAAKKAEQKWGSGIIERLSLDFKSAFLKQSGFSTTNLWYIKKWFVFYDSHKEKLHQLGGEFKKLFFFCSVAASYMPTIEEIEKGLSENIYTEN